MIAGGDIAHAREPYHPNVAYVGPTVRPFGWPHRTRRIDHTFG